MADTDTTALRDLLAKATPGRYVLDDHQVLVDSVEEDGFPSQTCVLEACIPVDAELATALHNAAPALLDELDRLTAENERLRAIAVEIRDKATYTMAGTYTLYPYMMTKLRAALEGRGSNGT